MSKSNPYENIFGPDKKKDTKTEKQNQQQPNPQAQQCGQNQPYGQYPNQQPPYGQYPQQPQYGQNQPYGQYPNQQPPYGQYPNQQPSYGQNQSYGQFPNQQPPYGQNPNQPYGQYPNQPGYNQNQPQYGQYPNQQPGYGQNPNQPQPYGQYPNQNPNQPPYNQDLNRQPTNNQDLNRQPSYNNQDLNRQPSYNNQDLNRQGTNPQQPPQYQHNPTLQHTATQPPMSQYPQQPPVNQFPQQPPIDQSKIDADAAALRKAMKGFGTDEKAIIKIIANRTNRERLAMIDSFKRQFNRDLIKDLKSELSGNFENATLALFQDPITYDCFSLQKAMKGWGTNEDTLIEILASRPNYYINQIKQRYIQLYGKPLEQDLASELSGDLKKVMMTLASAFRSENPNPNQAECHDKAEQLYKAGEKRWGTNEKVFYDILTKSSSAELALIDKIYSQNHKHGLLKAIDNEFSGNMKKLLKTIVYCCTNPSEYFATRVNYAIKGLGTKDTLLIRILVTRDEIDMRQIKEAYKRLYKRDMVKDVEGDTSGDYKRLLVELCSH